MVPAPRREQRMRRRTAIHRKLRVLDDVVPGCRRKVDIEDLFTRTAEYIFLLEVQIRVLRRFADRYGV